MRIRICIPFEEIRDTFDLKELTDKDKTDVTSSIATGIMERLDSYRTGNSSFIPVTISNEPLVITRDVKHLPYDAVVRLLMSPQIKSIDLKSRSRYLFIEVRTTNA